MFRFANMSVVHGIKGMQNKHGLKYEIFWIISWWIFLQNNLLCVPILKFFYETPSKISISSSKINVFFFKFIVWVWKFDFYRMPHCILWRWVKYRQVKTIVYYVLLVDSKLSGEWAQCISCIFQVPLWTPMHRTVHIVNPVNDRK